MAVWKNLRGTLGSLFRLGFTGPGLKDESGELAVRDEADAAYEAVRVALVKVYGDDIELNAGAAGAGADRKMTIRRPSTGMANDITVVMPSGNPTPGQVLSVASFGSNIVVLQYTTIAGGPTNILGTDSTTLAHGDTSPVAMFTKPANAIVAKVRVIPDTPFNGTPQLSIGIAGETSKYMASNQNDLTAAAGTVFEVDLGLPPTGGTEDLIATYSAGGASAGSARILVDYVVPS